MPKIFDEAINDIRKTSKNYNVRVHGWVFNNEQLSQYEKAFKLAKKQKELLDLYKIYTFSTKVSERIKTRDLITFVENEIKELYNE